MDNVQEIKTSSGGKLKWVLLIILLLIIVIGGVYYLSVERTNLLSQYFQKQSPIPGLTSSNPNADWQTYAAKEYGFELKYPDGWLQRKFINSPDQVLGMIFYEATDDDVSVSVQVYPATITPEELAEGAKDVASVENLDVDGYPAVKIRSEGTMSGSLSIFKDDKRFIMSTSIDTTSETGNNLWEKIISTFKFID